MAIKIESRGINEVFVISDTVKGTTEPYFSNAILAKINGKGNVVIQEKTTGNLRKPIKESGTSGIPFDQFIDKDDNTFASADDVLAWFYDYTSGF